MISTHEIIEYSKDLPIKLFCQRIGNVQRHWHRSIELLLVLSGEMEVRIEEEYYILKENDLILINSNQVHETYSEDCVLIALQIRLSMFHMDWLNADTSFFQCNSSIHGNNKHFDNIRRIIAQLIQLYSSTSSYAQLLSYSHACHLIYELLIYFKAEKPSAFRTPKQMERLRNIIQYIEENYNSEITLNDLAGREYLSPSYLSHFFEKNMNISISSYITKIRIEHSIHYLLYSDKSIEEIAETCGFLSPRSYAAFFRKQYNMLPSQYRKEKKGRPYTPDTMEYKENSSYLNLEKYDFFGKLSSYLNKDEDAGVSLSQNMKQHLGTILTKESVPFSNPALTFCSVGRAKEILYRNIQEMLTLQQKEIGFRYIKFHGIFDDALMVYREDTTGAPVLNFNMLDEILDFLLSIHLHPLIQFSFMPKALAKTPEKEFFAVPFIMSEPKDDTKWEYLVTQFTEHILERYGLTEVSKWIFTFWNETLSNFPFDFKNTEISFHLYEQTYNAVKKVKPILKFANTSYINSSLSSDTLKSFLDFIRIHKCEPDVYIFHFYPITDSHFIHMKKYDYDKFMEYISNNSPSLNTDPNTLGKFLDKLNNSLTDRLEKPLYITEWNLSPSHRELLNDTCYAAAYFIRNILKNYDKADAFCHWSLSDWIEELSFPAELFHGGVGHFTKNGIKKPTYYSYLYLSKLKEELVSQGEGYFITKEKDKDNYSIILYNYCHFSNLYSKGFNFNFSFTDRYHVFPGAASKELVFSLSGLADGDYIMTEQIVNRKYGSCYDKWVDMGAVSLETKDEIDTLKQLSHPLLKKTFRTVNNRTIDYEAVLEPHEIRLILISKRD
ncbi:MAG: helix-turn-helix domain-containing protein [Anaerocolumna sp.]